MPNLNFILGAVLAVILSFCGGFVAGDIHRGGVDEKNQAIEIAKANTQARAKEQETIKSHSVIEKTTLGEKDAIEKSRILFNAKYSANTFGLRQSSTSLSSGSNPALGIGSQTLRFSKEDAEFLNNFASECEVSQAERNEIILKYEALP